MADQIKNGNSFLITTSILNKYRIENGKPMVGRSTIINTHYHMSPVTSLLEQAKQGSKDQFSLWVRCCNNFARQLIVSFRIKTAEEMFEEGVQIPHGNSNDFLKNHQLSIHHIVFWDETHKKVSIEKQTSTKSSKIRFLQNKQGKIELHFSKLNLP